MKIDQVNIYKIQLPFKFDFAHALRNRTAVANIVVEVVAAGGTVRGYGEGAPRSYVTGETQPSAAENVRRFLERPDFPWALADIDTLWQFVDALPPDKQGNAALCALENALLDALGQFQRRPAADYFDKTFYTPQVFYGAPVPLGSRKKVLHFGNLIRSMGIRPCGSRSARISTTTGR